MRNLTCIVCPVGCSLDINDETQGNLFNENIDVTGNRCPRGAVYALEEIRAPKRVVTATALLKQSAQSGCLSNADIKSELERSIRRVPVKTASPCLRENIPALLDDIYKLEISPPVSLGDIVIANWNGEGIDVVATRSINN